MEAEPAATDAPHRILILGQSGSGKSTLARRLGDALGLPVHDLDLVFREGGGNGPERPVTARDADLAGIARSPAWVAEGVHVAGTGPLMEAADSIVWLDHLSWWRASGRITRRFAAGAWSEVRSRSGRKRFLRFGDYWRHLRELGRAIPESRRYGRDEPVAGSPSRREVDTALAPFAAKVTRVSADEELDALVDRFSRLAEAPARAR